VSLLPPLQAPTHPPPSLPLEGGGVKKAAPPFYRVVKKAAPLSGEDGPSVDDVNESRVGVKKVASPMIPSPSRDCVAMGELMNNVILNLFQDLINSANYETPK
jgi:hypothetical protein